MMPFGILGKFFHAFVLVVKVRDRGTMRTIVLSIMLDSGRNRQSVSELGHTVAFISECARARNEDLHNNSVHYLITMSCLQVGHKRRVPVSQSSISS